VRVNPYGDTHQDIDAPAFPDLPMCGAAPPPCSPTPFDAPALPNDIAFDHLGRAYVSDALQATVWRIPYGGGAPEIWLQDPRFIGEFGANGVRIAPDGRSLYIAVTGNPNPGAIYRVPLVAAPTAADVELFHQFDVPGPDGLAFGRSGRLYVTLAFTHAIAVLRPDGTEERRLTGPMAGPDGPIPWDNPAVLAFSWFTRRVFVANHALLSADPNHFNLFAVEVGERGVLPALPLILP
jgi:sugar lactone lactonase YvrE